MNAIVAPPRSWANMHDHWMLAMTHPWYRHLFAIQDVAVAAAHEFLRGEGLRHMVVPVTTGAISSPMGAGSDSVPVAIELAGRRTYLADSMQFALEYGCRMTDRGAYYVAQSFRGEEPDATHLPQFCHIEFEQQGGLELTMSLGWRLLQAMCAALCEEARDEVLPLAGSVRHLEELLCLPRPPCVRFGEVVERAGSDGVVTLPNGSRALTRSGESRLTHSLARRDALWVSHMDALSVPFYQARSKDCDQAICADLLLGGREVIGAGQRHVSGDEVREALEEHGVNPDEYDWYLRMKDERPLCTSGLGLGLERFLMWVTRTDDIRDIPLLSRLATTSSVP